MRRTAFLIMPILSLFVLTACEKRSVPESDSAYIDEHGTAHVTRVVPVPKTVSPEEQAKLGKELFTLWVDQLYEVGIVGLSPMVQGVCSFSTGTNSMTAATWRFKATHRSTTSVHGRSR